MDRALAFLAAGILSASVFGQTPLPQNAPARSLGVASCASSLCHGSVQPWSDIRVRQDEYVTWVRHDRHARAYVTLLTERSVAIARKMGYARPAHETPECLDCHAHNVPRERRGPEFMLSDGIACEACHGPAERWIKSHVEPNARRNANIARGLFPTRNPTARAQLCLSCHFGNEQKVVTHRMMAAGHPRLSFEFDTFTHLQPPHYGGDRGAAAAAGLADGVRNWAVGQTLAADSLLALLVHPVRGRDGLFPEPVLFDCHACHHPMSTPRDAGARLGIAPGLVRLNDSNLIMVRHIARRVAPGEAEALAQASAALYAAIAGHDDPLAQARRLRTAIQALMPKIEAHRFSAEDLHAIFNSLIDDGLAGQYSDYQGAEQAAMALQALADFMARRALLAPPAIRPAMDRMMATLANDESYRAPEFTLALRELRKRAEEARGK